MCRHSVNYYQFIDFEDNKSYFCDLETFINIQYIIEYDEISIARITDEKNKIFRFLNRINLRRSSINNIITKKVSEDDILVMKLIDGDEIIDISDDNCNKHVWIYFKSNEEYHILTDADYISLDDNSSTYFFNQTSITNIDMSMFLTYECRLFTDMFRGCHMLKYLDLSQFDLSNSNNFSEMFIYCISLRHITFNKKNIANRTYTTARMFKHCESLKEVDLSWLNLKQLVNMEEMFRECTNLKEITFLNNKNMDNKYITNIFYECMSLRSISFNEKYDFNVYNLYTDEWTFYDCKYMNKDKFIMSMRI